VESYCSTTLAGMRPRSLTAMACSLGQARMSPLRCRLEAGRGRVLSSPGRAGVLDERCELVAECGGVLVVQVDLVRAADGETNGLVGRATIKIVF
jgi:hypothetical protein